MNLQAFLLLTVLGTVMTVPQGNRRPNQRPSFQQPQQQQSQEPQFTNRFNPDENAQQDFSKQQPAAQQRASNSNSNNYRETTTFIPIIRFDKQQTGDGGYKTLWETGNNILAEETGTLRKFNGDKDSTDAVVQQGSYTYTSPEGQTITVQYTADENGFRATGDHLPTPPPIPAEIQKSLDTIYAGIAQQQRNGNNQQYQQDEGQYNEDQYNQPQQQQQFNNNNQQQQQFNNNNNNNNQQGNINFRPSGNRNNNFRG